MRHMAQPRLETDVSEEEIMIAEKFQVFFRVIIVLEITWLINTDNSVGL